MNKESIEKMLEKKTITAAEISELLQLSPEIAQEILHPIAEGIKEKEVGNVVYYRGLIEYSNSCAKDCYYCGIRKSNTNTNRYTMTDEEVLEAAKKAQEYNYGSVVIQSGELESPAFTKKIESLVKGIKDQSDGKLGITLSCGEQTLETYQRWKEAGAHRYLLRIETSNRDLYKKLHPDTDLHSFDNRLKALGYLREAGYQVGSGIMVGLPWQSMEDVAEDLPFLKEKDIDMCGLGPFIEHSDTPLYDCKDSLMPKMDRFHLALNTISILRILMKDINIASATALQAIDPCGREKALKAGSNIIMPNLTPTKYRTGYQLYENKPCMDEDAGQCKNCLEGRIRRYDNTIGYGEWGDSPHFFKRTG